MFTVTTAEIRWFVKGNIPKEINDWIQNLKGEIEYQTPRTDLYLNIKDTPNLGVKFREGRFEVKQKMAELGELIYGSNSGNAELWKKWSFEARDEKIQFADIINKEWVEVIKSRKLKKYIVTNEGEIKEGFDNYQSDGCNLELTEVAIQSSIWWTLGLETYGNEKTLSQNLNAAFQHIFKNEFSKPLDIHNSFAYPKWICQ